LFEKLKEKLDQGYFINADELEKKLHITGLIDLIEFGVTVS